MATAVVEGVPMILNEFGNPIQRPIGFITPQWVHESMRKMLASDVDAYSRIALEQRISDIYDSAGVERERGTIVGSTVRVRLPERWKKSNG